MIAKIKNSWKYKIYYRKWKLFLAANFYNNSKFLPEGMDRVYHYHIRKSAGTSINSAFWNLGGYSFKTVKREPILLGKGKAFVRYQDTLINKGNYFYASSHFPQWQLQLQPKTFTFTILRDPYQRLVSLYKYYCWVGQIDDVTGFAQDPTFFILKNQKKLIGKSFKNFIDNLSDKYLYNQLFMFSEKLNVEEAFENIKKVDKIYFQDNFSQIVKDLNDTLNINLEAKNERNFKNINFKIEEFEKEYVLIKLEEEIKFYNLVRNIFLNK